MNSRKHLFQSKATIEAFKSSSNFKHGALVTKGNQVYSKGFNNNRNKFLNIYDKCQHAEMSAVTKFINGYVVKNKNKYRHKCKKNKYRSKYDLKDFTVWCVRIPNDKKRQANMENVSSGPCLLCLQRLKEYGFGKIAYSNKHGDIEICKIRSYKKIHLSSAQKISLRNNNFNKNHSKTNLTIDEIEKLKCLK